MKGQLAPVLHYLYRVRRIGDDSDSDGHLLRRFTRQADSAAFTSLVQRHGPMVLGVCRRILHDANDADDAFQTTFLLLVRKASGLRNPDRLGPWLHGVACRTALKARSLRLRNRDRQQPLGEVAAKDSDDPIWRDLRPILDDAVRALPEKYREPFVLCYLEGLTNAEAAQRLGCPPGTIATRLSRARDLLRVRLTRRGVSLSAAGLALALATGAATATVPRTLIAVVLRMISGDFVSPSVSSLMKGVCKAMFMEKLRFVAILLAALLTAGTGAGWLVHRAQAYETGKPPVAAPPPATVDPPSVRPITEAPDEKTSPAKVTTKNFAVTAPTQRIARLVADVAERERKDKAILWLGKELPAWSEPCPVEVQITKGSFGGNSTFEFDHGKVLSRSMHHEGSLDQMLVNGIPHEVTHAVLADHFGEAVPRWADEGAAMLSEDEQEHTRYEKLAKEILVGGHRFMPLNKLFPQKQYPSDVMVLYAEGYSVTRFLVERKDRKTFLAFVKQGMKDDWDAAAKKSYGFEDVNEMEKAWIASIVPASDPQRDNPKRTGGDKAAGRNALPLIGVASIWENGRYVIIRLPNGHRTITTYRLVEKGDRKYYEPQTVQIPDEQVIRIDLPLVSVYDTTGQPVSAMKAAQLIKDETPVLVATDGKPVDPFYLKLAKEGTLSLVISPSTFASEPAIPR